jgi:exopolyphosphatase/pppGpp-phosphohydrolase
VGLFLGHSGNHKHAYYIVKSSELLLGFQPMELEVIALLTRYHRKKAPSSSSADLKKLPEDIRKKVIAPVM